MQIVVLLSLTNTALTVNTRAGPFYLSYYHCSRYLFIRFGALFPFDSILALISLSGAVWCYCVSVVCVCVCVDKYSEILE